MAIAACFFTWLVLDESSPLSEYFLYHVTLPNLLMKLHSIPYIILLLIRPETETAANAISWGLIFFQWLLVGYLLSFLICGGRLKSRPID
ncbi:MAG: hypothetical protein LC785_08770 [Acidobacteria bacterium]|nr:hypothetical protein [Acidobacteriota bacterium]MCA1642026.1 hypothetical protein [Acidobacteriota bacterium]